MSTHNLGQFIRKHRERLRPEDVGLRPIGRRRTPGLRREELAQLCAVSPTWITWLEQGRPVSASTAMLERLSEVLRLTIAERHYLFTLAGKLDHAGEPEHSDGLKVVLDGVTHMTAPAYVLDRLWNALAWNTAAEELFTGWLDGDDSHAWPNLLRFTFLSPAARVLVDDWADRAKRLVAEFRADCALHVDDGEVRDLISELSGASKEFSTYWMDYDVTEREGGLRVFHHPTRGRLSYTQTTFNPATRRDLKLVLLLPE